MNARRVSAGAGQPGGGGGVTGSTLPRRQLGRQLRDLRNRAGMTTRAAARHLEWSEAKIWRIETGQTSLRGLDVEAMCKVYAAPDELVEPLTVLARQTKARGWWAGYSDAIPEGFEVFLGLEEAASALRSYEVDTVPGLLQTEAYTRALLAGARPGLTAEQTERRLRLRAVRQEQLTRSAAPLRLDVLIAEPMLWRRLGGSEVAGAQLDRLRELADLPNIRIRVVPADSGYHPGMESGRFVVLEFDPGATAAYPEPPVVYVEAFTGPLFVDKEQEVARYRAAFAGIEAVAVDARRGIEDARTAL
ncbi:helix-turn-helix transcriptional regulator [Nocardia sp. NPDC050697]|uniref:helix-turn-helix domain-containing protein n=1 Tax=Nocardia sp. NPDC050697 TaxID=3155158 RepID=UPI003409A2EB